jgi:hypothetical protein
MKEKITNVLKTYKNTQIEKNRILAQKAKEIKLENQYLASLQKMSIDEKNKNICSTIKEQEKQNSDKKKREEVLQLDNLG